MSSSLLVHPALLLLAAAFVVPWLRGNARNLAILLSPLLAMVALWLLPEGRLWQVDWLDYSLAPLVVDKLSRLFATMIVCRDGGCTPKRSTLSLSPKRR